jgi:hypothetical protein
VDTVQILVVCSYCSSLSTILQFSVCVVVVVVVACVIVAFVVVVVVDPDSCTVSLLLVKLALFIAAGSFPTRGCVRP